MVLQTGNQSCDDLNVGVSFSPHTIRQQQNAGMGQLTTGRFPFGNAKIDNPIAA